jgi:two-component system, OmpR family, response regulator
MQSKILLVEDDITLADSIVNGFANSGYSIFHLSDGIAGYEMASQKEFDIMILDIMLPGMNGLDIIQKLRKNKIGIPILVLSAKISTEDRVKGLQTGSDDYLVKPFEFSELLARVQALIRRSSQDNIPETTSLQVHDLYVDLIKRKVWRGNQNIELRPKEYDLLEYLVRNSGRIISKNMIIENVWDFNFDPMTNIVESKICLLRDKIDKEFPDKLIHTVRGVGYVIEKK